MTLLKGVTVVESATVITGPFAGMILGDLGADVIKVEPPTGDAFRRWEAEGDRVRPSFAAFNRGKRSVAIDLKDPEGKEVFGRLVRDADAVIENARPGVMDRLDVGYEACRAVNPEIVYCAINGMGMVGPERDRPTYDAVAQALSGLWSQYTGMDDPEPVGPPAADQLTGIFAAIAVLSGILHRRGTGDGIQLDVSMLASCLAFQPMEVASVTRQGVVPTKVSRGHRSQSYAFVAGDGRCLAVHLSTPHKFWVGLCEVVGRPDLLDDQRFGDKAARVENYTSLHDELAATIRTQPRQYWLDLLASHDVPAAPINRLDEAISHPQVAALGLIDEGTDERLHGLVRSPIAADGTHLRSDRPPPTLSQDGDSVLTAIGYSPVEIERLRATGVVG